MSPYFRVSKKPLSPLTNGNAKKLSAYDPRLWAIINRADFHARTSSRFGEVKAHAHARTNYAP